jgi:sortase A
MRKKLHRILDRLLLAAGVTLLVVFAAALVYRSILSRVALAQFDQAQAALTQRGAEPNVEVQGHAGVEVRLWSRNRIGDYRKSLFMKIDPPLAVLRLDRLRIRVPVFAGTGDLVLNRGAGWITGTARPGAAGNSNIGIAGHRDGFFRAFKNIRVGDAIELLTTGLVSRYAVSSFEIVDPDKVEVLRPRGVPSLTLVTCYPFYFLGDAPKRFIVHATLKRQVGI